MDPGQQDLLFEGFLRKRKDTMKFAWAKYWFKLQNTTLYFYTKREAQPEYLRGEYYMYSVQSVRSVTSPDGDFTFEIVMKNGKKKLLSAESEDVRDVWIKLLWKSMQLPGPGRSSSSCTWYDVPELLQRTLSAPLDCTKSEQTPSDDISKNPIESAPQSAIHDYNFPKSTPAVSADHSGSGRDANPDSNIYDVPRPLIHASTPPAAALDAAPPASPVLLSDDETRSASSGAEPQYVAMTDLDIYDSPAAITSQKLTGPVTTGTSDV